jgi:hypothetical protein
MARLSLASTFKEMIARRNRDKRDLRVKNKEKVRVVLCFIQTA